jgi:H+-translocating NAD(P) transhydrogenase
MYRNLYLSIVCLNELKPTGIPYNQLTIGVPRETFEGECRVSLSPANTTLLLKKGFSKILVERSAGVEAQFLDEHYSAAGAQLASEEEVFGNADILLKVRAPLLQNGEVERLRERSTLISFLYPAQNQDLVKAIAARGVNAFAMDMIPRISRAQVFDALR